MAISSSRRNVGLTVVANISVSVVGAITGISLARVLGPTSRGDLAAVQIWGFFFGTIAAVGVPDAVVYFVARRRDQAGSYLATAATLNLLTSLVFTAVAWFTVPFLLGSQSETVKDLARIFVLGIPIYVLTGTPGQALRGSNEFLRWNILRLMPPLLWLTIIAVAYVTNQFSVSFLTVGFIASQFVILAVAIVATLPKVHGPYRVVPARWPALLRFGIPGVLSTVPGVLNLRLDQMLLAAFVSSEQLGLYVAAVAWSGITAPVILAIGSVLFPRLAGEADEKTRAEVLARGMRLAALLACGFGFILLVATPVGVRLLFGADFSAAAPAAAVLVCAGGVLALNGVLQEGVRGLGRPAEVLWAELSGLVLTALLLAALLPVLGILGAAFASLGGYLGTFAVLVVRLKRTGGIHRIRSLLPTPTDARDLAIMLVQIVKRSQDVGVRR